MKKLLGLLAITVLLCAFVGNVWASDFDFYGSLRFETFNEDYSKETKPNGSAAGILGIKDDADTKWGTLGTSRIGAKIKLSDNLTGLFELGVGDEDLTLRHFYGEYNFGTGKILVGQTWHPVGVPYANYSKRAGLSDNGLLQFGSFYSGRVEMIKLTFGDIQIAFIEPKVPQSSKNFASAAARTGNSNGIDDVDVTLPQIALGYSLKYSNIIFDAVGAYQTYDEIDVNRGEVYDVDSYVVKFGLKGEFGQLMLGATYGWGRNIIHMGSLAASHTNGNKILGTEDADFDANRGILLDTDTKAYTLVGAYKASDRLRFEAGYGYVESDPLLQLDEDDGSTYYLQADITIADRFVVTPEIGKIDFGNFPNGRSEGDMTYFGAKWQIDF